MYSTQAALGGRIKENKCVYNITRHVQCKKQQKNYNKKTTTPRYGICVNVSGVRKHEQTNVGKC